MPMHHYTAQKIELLKQQFIENYTTAKNRNLFKKELIITASNGMQEWLANEVTQELKIFAHFEFSEIDRFFNEMGEQFGVFQQQTSSVTTKWYLFKLLGTTEFTEQFQEIANYYLEDDIKRVQLAEKVAALFGAYQEERTSIIAQWNEGKKANNSTEIPNFEKHEVWQRWLWNALKKSFEEDTDKTWIDRLQFKEQLCAVLQNNPELPYNSISVFANNSISDANLELLSAIATYITVNIYVVSPSLKAAWWTKESEHQNSLLRSCGKQVGHLLTKTSSLVNPDQVSWLKNNKVASTTLGKVQEDLLENTCHQGKTEIDNSILFASSYTEAREVEALYNYLLQQFEENPSLTAKDVLVQATDIALYEPFIHAVFDNGPQRIPYKICNSSNETQYSLINALNLVFSLQTENFKAEYVLNLLEFTSVKNRFGIEDTQAIIQFVKAANIRFGTQGNQTDESYLVSWAHGLKKLMLGTVIKGEQFVDYENEALLLCDAAEENKALEIYKLKAFIDTLMGLSDALQTEKSIAAWIHCIKEAILPSLFEKTKETEAEIQELETTLHRLRFLAKYDEKPIPFEVFKELALKDLSEQQRYARYISGSITFSNMQSVQHIPYKVIAILGLNGTSFPQKNKKLGFSLIDVAPQKGDTNAKEKEQYQFLSTLLAAREKLYLSYIGRSSKTNEHLPPSLVVEELQSYLKTKYATNTDNETIVEHPMHSFSRAYNNESKLLYTFTEKEEEYNKTVQKSSPYKHREWETISIEQLVRFFKEPIKWYFNNTLGIYYNAEDNEVANEEIFELDKLQEWSLKNELLNSEKTTNYLNKYLKSKGAIPLASMGVIAMDTARKVITPTEEKIKKHSGSETLVKHNFNLKTGSTTITSTTLHTYGHKQIIPIVSESKTRTKYLVEAYIKHLFLIANNNACQTIVIFPDKEEIFPSNIVTASKAKTILKDLVSYFKQGQKKLLEYSLEGFNPKPYKVKDGIVKNVLDGLKYEGNTGFNKDYYDKYIARVLEFPELEATLIEKEEMFTKIKELLLSWNNK